MLEKKANELMQLNPTAYKTLLMTKALHVIWFGSESFHTIYQLTAIFKKRKRTLGAKGYDSMLRVR